MYSFELSSSRMVQVFFMPNNIPGQFISREIQGKGFDSENDPANSYTVMGEGGVYCFGALDKV